VNSSAVGSEALAAVLRERTNSFQYLRAPRNDTSVRPGNYLACIANADAGIGILV
jgi:hypothetical protein